jgi:predicted nucleotidyltransferase
MCESQFFDSTKIPFDTLAADHWHAQPVNSWVRLSLFGSVLRDDFQADSDIDFLVEFEPGNVPGLIGYCRMERELSELIGNRKVDLRTPQELSKYFRDEVLAQAEVQYAAA